MDIEGIGEGMDSAGFIHCTDHLRDSGVIISYWADLQMVIRETANGDKIAHKINDGILLTPVWMYNDGEKLFFDTISIMRWLKS